MFNSFNLNMDFCTSLFFRNRNRSNGHILGLDGRKMLEQLGIDPVTNFSPKNQDMGNQFVTWQKNNNSLPTLKSRKDCFAEFAKNVNRLRDRGLGTQRKIRFIDKVDYSLDVSVVRSLTPSDAVNLYKRQMGFLSMYSSAPNPFQAIRDLFSGASVYSRPENGGYTPAKDFAGTYVNFLLDYYFSMYIPNSREWDIYLMQQRMALNEIENDVFTMLNGQSVNNSLDENGEIQVTAFSTVGLELIADILRPVRIDSPQIESFEPAFTDDIWMNYFPYTWALVNPSAAYKIINH